MRVLARLCSAGVVIVLAVPCMSCAAVLDTLVDAALDRDDCPCDCDCEKCHPPGRWNAGNLPKPKFTGAQCK